MIRVQFVPGFYQQEDVVLATMDRRGLSVLLSAMRAAAGLSVGQAYTFTSENQEHHIAISAESSRVESDAARVTWNLHPETFREIADKLAGMSEGSDPCHNYIDIEEPARTLYLSVDEYAWHDGAIRSVQPGIAGKAT